ncbi:MAG: HEAT repeat domain-containing protein [Candidatus Wallbacteria bacterium]|nr:HEAT repeat domain-containing protein [Candidatus Wallbacteria bacterium]
MPLSRELELLAEQLKSPDRMVRMRALVLMVNKGDTSLEPLLSKLAAKDESPEIRYYAKKAINMLATRTAPAQAPGEPKAYVRPAALEGPAPAAPAKPTPDDVRRMILLGDVRQKVMGLKLACELDLKAVSPDIGEMLRKETDPVALSAAAIAAGRLGGPSHSRKLVDLLEHADPRVRANAVDGLEATGDGAVFPYLIRCLRDEDNRCRANAARALRSYGPVNQKETLRLMLESDEVWMQDSAVYVLGFLSDPGAFALFNIALRSPHKVVREQVRLSLSRLKEKGNERAGDLLARLGGERQGRSEEELFERLSKVTADIKLPTLAPPAEPPPPPAEAAEAPAPPVAASVAQSEAAPAPEMPAPPPPVADIGSPEEPPELPEPHKESKTSQFFRPAPKRQVRRKSAEDALAALSAVQQAEVADLDFLVKDELRQDRAYTRLTDAFSDAPLDREELVLTRSQRAALALLNLGDVKDEGDGEPLPQQREEHRMEQARERLAENLKDLRGASSLAEAISDKLAREDSIFERLKALG